ncbi:hypothetical protein EON67_01375 [archaeon]|nr:MAG: hypothetical protein EON67_01375 [archaeon]
MQPCVQLRVRVRVCVCACVCLRVSAWRCARAARLNKRTGQATRHTTGTNHSHEPAAHAQTHTHACTRTLTAAPPHTSTHIACTHARTHARSPPPAPRSTFASLSLTAPPSTATLPCAP